ncbi:hypothetical protein GGX14DRAFT_449195 [Mycena pura]|uniref:F-box domain-containing protein n=1 Tax=Mycena pura TaxID=153505 RepID=A0AAD6YB20_9AGAR|nr:hypothetical protein GGX14DRAFT_449195 [Mycena pura]
MSLLRLSPELHLSVFCHLSLPEKNCLRLVCHLFNNLLCLDVPLAQLQVAEKKKTIFLVEGAKKGHIGREPFIVRNPRISVADSGDKHILMDIYYPKFMRNDDEDTPTDNEWEIHIHMNELSLECENILPSDSTRLVKSISYDSLRGKLLKASAGLFRTRFRCPECSNSRSVCPGCGGFSRRFSDLFCSCGWPMPCPVCIGFGVAYNAKDIQDDDAELNELWKEINEMLAEDA